MRKMVRGRQLGRTKNQRRALFRGLIAALIEKSTVVTTEAKAKAVRGQAEKLITRARKGTLSDRRQLFRRLGNRQLVNRLVAVVAPLFKERKGGYLRIVRLSSKRGDGGQLVQLSLVDKPTPPPSQPPLKKDKTPTEKAEKVKKAK